MQNRRVMDIYVLCVYKGLLYHIVNCIQIFYFIRFNVYNLYHSIFYIIYIFDFAFKITLTSFFLVNDRFVELLQLIFVDFVINVIMCFIFHTYFFLLFQNCFINCMLEDIIVSLVVFQTFLSLSILTMVFSRSIFSVLRKNAPKTLN